MDKYLKIVEAYLNRPKTDYALMINGDWGSGKTYFIEKEISDVLKTKQLRLAYISLNGVTSIEEVSKIIFFETSRLLGNETIRNLMNSEKGKLFKNITKFSVNFGLSYKGMNQTSFLFEELVSLNENIVLCFDDLERVKINIEEILGFINFFVEHDSIKTLILANEKEILSDLNYLIKDDTSVIPSYHTHIITQNDVNARNNYIHIKEKTIGKTIYFYPNIKEILPRLLDDFSRNEIYNQFLRNNLNTILDLFKFYDRKNIRILKHALNDFQVVFEYIESIENKFELTNNHKTELHKLLFFTVFISSSELRMGNILIENLKNLQQERVIPVLGSKLKTKPEFFFTKYFSTHEVKLRNPYYHLPSLYEYVISGYLDLKKLEVEIQNVIFDLKEKEEKLEYEKDALFILLNNYFNLEDNMFKEYFAEALSNIKSGKYKYYDYLNAFNLFEYFSKKSLISYSTLELLEFFKNGFDIYLSNTPTVDPIKLTFMNFEEGRSEYYTNLEEYMRNCIANYMNDENISKFEKMSKLLSEDFKFFVREVFSKVEKKDNILDLLHYLGSDTLNSHICMEMNENINFFANYVNGFYENESSVINFPEDHVTFWSTFTEKMFDSSRSIQDIYPLKTVCLENCVETINNTMDNLKNLKNPF